MLGTVGFRVSGSRRYRGWTTNLGFRVLRTVCCLVGRV